MQNCVNPIGVSLWIPIIGTLLGAAIGLTGGLLNSWFTNKSKLNSEKENRERQRIEATYEILEEARMYYKSVLTNMISKVLHDNINLNKNEYSGLPPLIKLDMFLHMYFPLLTLSHKKFVSAKEDFGQKFGENITKSFNNKSLKEKQELCEEYLTLFSAVDTEISNLQQKLVAILKV